jgi:hypothetical protein
VEIRDGQEGRQRHAPIYGGPGLSGSKNVTALLLDVPRNVVETLLTEARRKGESRIA